MTALSLSSIAEAIESERMLTFEEGMILLRDLPLHTLGRWADTVRQRKNGRVAWYNLNTHLNPTNLCITRCPLCAFRVEPDSDRAKTVSMSEVAARAVEAAQHGSTEIHIVGGMHPDKPYAWYRDIISTVRSVAPTLHIKAWTAPEIVHFTQLTGWNTEQVLSDMINAGLGSLPGGGAEIFAEKPRQLIAPNKIDAATWLAVHRIAHRLGLWTNATMLFGHLETLEDRIDHLVRLRDLQAESLAAGTSGAFNAFVPLVYQPHATCPPDTKAARKKNEVHTDEFEERQVPDRLEMVVKTSPHDMLRTIAVARLFLYNIPHVKAYWVTLGPEIAQLAIGYGADDLDGTIRGERVHHDAGATSPVELSVERLCELIAETGYEPCERDSHYHRVKEACREDAKK